MTYTPLEKKFSKILELESNYSKAESSSIPNFPQILTGYDKNKYIALVTLGSLKS